MGACMLVCFSTVSSQLFRVRLHDATGACSTQSCCTCQEAGAVDYQHRQIHPQEFIFGAVADRPVAGFLVKSIWKTFPPARVMPVLHPGPLSALLLADPAIY